jgi:hypothetical protein
VSAPRGHQSAVNIADIFANTISSTGSRHSSLMLLVVKYCVTCVVLPPMGHCSNVRCINIKWYGENYVTLITIILTIIPCIWSTRKTVRCVIYLTNIFRPPPFILSIQSIIPLITNNNNHYFLLLQYRLTAGVDPLRWPRDPPLYTEVGTKFRRQVAVAQSV